MLFAPPPPLSPKEQDALVQYSRTLHDYTLGLWTESRRTIEHSRQQRTKKPRQSWAAQRPPTPRIRGDAAGYMEGEEGDDESDDEGILVRPKGRVGSSSSSTSEASSTSGDGGDVRRPHVDGGRPAIH
jgi:hypothetical protein